MNKKILFFIPLMFLSTPSLGALIKTTCVISTVYESCNAGYYLSSANCRVCADNTYKSTAGTGACSTCPTQDGASGITSGTTAANHDSATDCYIPALTNLTDSTGTYQFTSNCNYST